MPQLFHTITIIGAGHIGSSVARAVKQLGLARQVIIGDSNPAHCAAALDLGFADIATEDLAESVPNADLVMLATPPSTFGSIMAAIAPHLKTGCIITDVGSVKGAAIAAIDPHMPAHAAYVPGHPIAGNEHSGPQSGFAALFQDKWFVLTPTPATPLAALAPVQALWEALGCHVTTLTPEHHDEIFALTSHLPTLLSFALVNTAIDGGEAMQTEVLQFAASGFRGATRLAKQDPTLWCDIFLANQTALLQQLERVQAEIASMAQAIRWQNPAQITERLERARTVRRSLPE